jgi:hypothetical protein
MHCREKLCSRQERLKHQQSASLPVGVCSKNAQGLPSTAVSSLVWRCLAATSPAYAKENALTYAVINIRRIAN